MSAVREFSAGCVVFHEDDEEGRTYLLLQYGAGHWGFPKGHIEGSESELETMARELEEETGIAPEDQRVVKGFEDETHYAFQRGRTTVQKTVFFFLVESRTREVRTSHEHKGHAWLSFDEAIMRVTFEDPRRILRRAEDHLEARD